MSEQVGQQETPDSQQPPYPASSQQATTISSSTMSEPGEPGFRWMYIFVHMTRTEDKPHMWSIACPPTNFTGDTVCDFYYVWNEPPESGGFRLEEGTQILRSMGEFPFHAWSSVHRICSYRASSHANLVRLIREACGPRVLEGVPYSQRWHIFILEVLSQWEWVAEQTCRDLCDLLLTRASGSQIGGAGGAVREKEEGS
ncbi:hypothetical protein BDW75DRAFT_241441 [Aspergillus navahoensis]